MEIDYSYGADGRLKLSTDHKDATLDRAYKYDQVGRLVEAFTASEARSWVQNGSIGTTVDGPYRQAYTLDAWDNMTQKWGRSYNGTYYRTQGVDDTYSSTTGRNSAWTYDVDGRTLSDGSTTDYMYDEAGGLREVSNSTSGTFFTQDGDGQKAKMIVEGTPTHYLHSSVLDQTIAEVDTDGSRKYGFVYADGQLIATQVVGAVFWQHTDASGRSRRTTIAGGHGQAKDEVDPMDVKLDRPGLNNHNTAPGVGGKSAGGAEARVASLMDLSMCDFVGMLVPCSMVGQFTEQIGEALPAHQLFFEYGIWDGMWENDAAVMSFLYKINPLWIVDLRETQDEAAAGLLAFTSSNALQQDKKKRKKKRMRSAFGDVNSLGAAARGVAPQNAGPITRQQIQTANDAVDRRYDYCKKKHFGSSDVLGTRHIPGPEAAVMTLAAGMNNADVAARVAGIFSQESDFNLNPNNWGADAGPAQLTGAVLKVWAWAVVGDAFGTRLVKNSKGQPAINNLGQWDGNSWDNMATMRNIVQSYSSDYDAAYAYGPGPNSARAKYAKEVTARTPTYNNFFNCLLGKE